MVFCSFPANGAKNVDVQIGDEEEKMLEGCECCWRSLKVELKNLQKKRSPWIILVGYFLMLKSIYCSKGFREKAEKGFRGEGRVFVCCNESTWYFLFLWLIFYMVFINNQVLRIFVDLTFHLSPFANWLLLTCFRL